MKIGFICAIPDEARHILQEMQIEREVVALKNHFYEGKFMERDLVMVVSGMGKVSSALCTQYLIDHFQVDLILFSGIAGGLKSDLHIGDTVIGTEFLYHDVDRQGEEIDENVPHALLRNRFKADVRLIDLIKAGLQDLKLPFPEVLAQLRHGKELTISFGRILTGDQVITSKAKVAELYEQYQGACVEMEGASIAQACFMNDKPFLIIRTISDLADEEAMKVVKQTMKSVVQINYQILRAVIDLI